MTRMDAPTNDDESDADALPCAEDAIERGRRQIKRSNALLEQIDQLLKRPAGKGPASEDR